MISKPKEYIDILLKDMVTHVQIATSNYIRESYLGNHSLYDLECELKKELDKIDKTKQEILYVIELIQQDNSSAVHT